jgi:predicted transposase YbfD/YdcC
MKWGDIMTLIEILSEIPDFRKDKGKRHPLPAILALACVATMCGCKTYSAIAQWGRNYDQRFTKALGFIHDKTPCAATFCNVFCNIAIKIMESKLGQWATSIGVSTDVSTSGQEDFQEEAISIDGKTLKGSLKQGSSITHLLSAVSHKSGLTLAQCSVDKETNEIGTIDEILNNLVLEGRIVSVDAMHTQRETSQTIIDGGGDYVMPVKDNQQRLLDDVKTVFEGPCSHLLSTSSAKTLDVGHGRIEERHLTASDALFGYSDWPGLYQVFKIERRFIRKRTGEVHQETVYGITSLTPQEADPYRLLSLIRGHWHIENRSHWVRDVTFDEDRSQVRKGNTPEVMSSLRNTVIGLLRYSGETNITSACRRYAAQPLKALELIGISL